MAKMKNYFVKLSFKLIKKRKVLFDAQFNKFIGKRYFFIWLDVLCSFVLFGSSFEDYFRYEFYKKSWRERNKFITYGKSKKLIKKYNFSDFDKIKTLNDKARSNQFFKDYICREWMDTDCSDDEAIMSFVEKHEKTIMKPKNGSCGKGIFIFDKNDISSAKIPKGYVVEEFINQHSELEKLNPSSVKYIAGYDF